MTNLHFQHSGFNVNRPLGKNINILLILSSQPSIATPPQNKLSADVKLFSTTSILNKEEKLTKLQKLLLSLNEKGKLDAKTLKALTSLKITLLILILYTPEHLETILKDLFTGEKSIITYCTEYLKLNTPQNPLKLLEIKQPKGGRFKEFKIQNPNLVENFDSLDHLHNLLWSDERFLSFGKHKVIITSAKADGVNFNFHHNIKVTNDTSVEQYKNIVTPILESIPSEDSYFTNVVNTFYVKVWNMDHLTNSNIKVTSDATVVTPKKSVVTPKKPVTTSKKSDVMHKKPNNRREFSLLSSQTLMQMSRSTSIRLFSTALGIKTSSTNPNDNKRSADSFDPIVYTDHLPKKHELKGMPNDIYMPTYYEPKAIAAMDIETMVIPCLGDAQQPIMISHSDGFTTNLFSANRTILRSGDPIAIQKEIDSMWQKYFNSIKNKDGLTIFVHNLGDFDGLFLIKALAQLDNQPKPSFMMVAGKSFIAITQSFCDSKGKQLAGVTFKDSCRLFPMSLDNLCQMFLGETGKPTKYNPLWNTVEVLERINQDEYVKLQAYSKSDVQMLYRALSKAQEIYIQEHLVDIATCHSATSTSLKIFLAKYLTKAITCLTHNEDKFVRHGYYGGATEVYNLFGEKLNYYDLNSMYPSIMRNKPLPIEPIGKIKPVTSLQDFFGFVEVEVTCPKSVKTPVLPCKTEGRTIYPTGSWKGVYFSEILKAAMARGYIIKPIRGLEFTKGNPFNEYIDDFYSIKALAKGVQKAIAKLHLNTLYGVFGRRVQTLKSMIVDNDKLESILLNQVVKTVTPLSEFKALIVIDLAAELSNKAADFNTTVEKGEDKFLSIKSNVAIAAAITAYGQMELMPIKDLGIVVYSDTDSVITTQPLPKEFIGTGLGQWKDELDGGIITRAYFLGIKKYCYEYQDKSGAIHCKSVFTGVPRNTLSFEEVESIVKGSTITKILNNRFVRNNQKLEITIKPAKVTIQFNCHKELSGNNYLPPHVELLKST